MKIARCALAVLLALSVVPLRLVPQESSKPDAQKASTTLKVQVILVENEGEKKVANLPYTFFLKAPDPSSSLPSWSMLRIGSRVPVYAGKEGGMQYIDIGTSIDARAKSTDSGRFDVYLKLERSWVEGEVSIPAGVGQGGATDPNAPRFKEPIIRQFKTDLDLTMHDAESIQTAQAADPLSARILSITVSVNVVK
jgi:hypothetical protein